MVAERAFALRQCAVIPALCQHGIEADWDDNINQRILVRGANFYHSFL